ncbi:carboxymuconolactone decarboxylase family protein [Faunimonas sp. B44]|uniref:carboxymuconolactone decarboxylase family protein n=1 Tax=Faunimonas sp. B44 TaxID=3461493 RepID=UPI0040441530
MPRIPPVDPAALTPEQAAAHAGIAAGARGEVSGPFPMLLHSPRAAAAVEQLGVHIRYRSALPDRIRALAVAIVGRHWYADYQWHIQATRAEELGVPRPVLDAIAEGRVPDFDEEEDRIAYAFLSEVLKSSGLTPVPEGVFAAARSAFGDEGLVDLTVLAGYYSLLAMVLNTFEIRPEGGDVPWRRPSEDEGGQA